MGGETPIGFMALDAYARRYGIEGKMFERFHTFMTAIDDEWLTYGAKQPKTDTESG
jgi:hypothetical protein